MFANLHEKFFTHTQNMCFFLQAQVWHKETGKTINRLSNSSTNQNTGRPQRSGQASIENNRESITSGSPRNAVVADVMRRARKAYHNAVRALRLDQHQLHRRLKRYSPTKIAISGRK